MDLEPNLREYGDLGRDWRGWVTIGERPHPYGVSVDRLGASSAVIAEEDAMQIRYGTNPHQKASIEPVRPDVWPFRVVGGEPSLINVLDALNAWQLVREAAETFGRPAATSFKHVSPAGAAVAGPVDPVMSRLYRVDEGSSPVARAYGRARDADPKSSYGDMVAVSHPVDDDLADLLAGVASDGIIAPGYAPGTVARLAAKKGGRMLVLEADPGFPPPPVAIREIFGVQITEERDTAPLRPAVAGAGAHADDLLLGLITLRYTQSNSVCYVRDGMTLGIGAGQQSRIDCTRLAGAKVDTWWLRRSPALPESGTGRKAQAQVDAAAALGEPERSAWLAELSGVAYASDGFLPFRDNVDEAAHHGVVAIAEPGGSIRADSVAEACQEHGITLIRTGVRLFHH